VTDTEQTIVGSRTEKETVPAFVFFFILSLYAARELVD